MKKILTIIISVILVTSLLAACAPKATQQPAATPEPAKTEPVTLKIGATPIPHGEILDFVLPLLEKENIKVEIVEFTDYVQPNVALNDKELDANFFQHVPYLNEFNAENGMDLVSAGKVHVEPLGLYSNKIKTISELKDGSTIAIPNDATNGGRALLLLQANGLIKINESAGITATEKDITENPKKLKFEALEAAQLPRVLDDVDCAVINTNYAIPANLNPSKDALIIEGKDSPYANIITVRKGDESRAEIKKLVEILTSPEVKTFLEEKYQGAIVPAF